MADDERFEFERGPLAEVCWIDSSGTHGWSILKDEIDNPKRKQGMYCRTVGYVVAEDDDSLMLTNSLSGAGSMDCGTTIPKFAIVSQRTL
jgi:hypothetical protein